MTEAIKPVPEGYHTVTPYFTVADAGGFLDFLKQVFDAEETERMTGPDGQVRHAEARIGNSKVMIGQATEQWKGKPNSVYVYVADVDATYHKALGAGARTISEPTTHFYGDRSGGIEDSDGNTWWIASRVENVPSEEVQRRFASQGKA